jgi:hypothetical protein
MADPGLDPDPPVAQPAEGAGPLQRPPGLAWVPLRCNPIRATPSSASSRSLAALPNPRSPTTVPGARPVIATTHWTAGPAGLRPAGCSAGAGGRRQSRARPRPPAGCSRTGSDAAACPCGSDERPDRSSSPAALGSPDCRQAAARSATTTARYGRSWLQLADQPAKPPVTASAHQGAAGVARHRLDLSERPPGNRRDLTGQPVDFRRRHPVRRRSVRANRRSRPAARPRSRNRVLLAAPRALMRRTSPPNLRTACSNRSASVG